VYVPVPCPNKTHERTILIYRDFGHATLFCLPCETAFSVVASTQAIRDVPPEQFGYSPIDTTRLRDS
jgi:hypothetical protein